MWMKIYHLALNQLRHSGWQIKLQEESEDCDCLELLWVGVNSCLKCRRMTQTTKTEGKRVFEDEKLKEVKY